MQDRLPRSLERLDAAVREGAAVPHLMHDIVHRSIEPPAVRKYACIECGGLLATVRPAATTACPSSCPP